MNLAKGRILIIDDDVALLGLLKSLLEEAGCVVETIPGVVGFTPQLMALSRPSLVLLNPIVNGFTRELLRSVVKEFRRSSRAPVVLLADLSPNELDARVKDLGADGALPIRILLRDPLGALMRQRIEQPGGPATPPRSPSAPRKVTELDAAAILDLDLAPLQSAPPPAPDPAPQGIAPGSLAANLLSAIEDELEDVAPIEILEGVEHYDVALDVMSEANLYIDGAGLVTGLFVPSAMPPEIGSSVDLSVTFPWGGQLSCEAKVEWTRALSNLGRRSRSGFGARFPQLSPAQLALLQRFLKLRVPMQVVPPVPARKA